MILKNLILSSILFFPLTVFAQITFEKGYFIDNDGNKVECFIRNMGWKYNPNRFEYKLSREGESKTMDISSIKEFGIDNSSKYVNKKVKIDRSTDDLASLNYERGPVWSEEQLPLKVLVEGKASLYSYLDRTLARFFYSVNGSEVQQLVYKKYLVAINSVGINSDFRQQLWTNVNCGGSSQNSMRNISYYTESLVQHFNAYNGCSDGTKVDSTKVRSNFNLKFKTGVDFATFEIVGVQYFNFGLKASLRIGLEAEYIFPAHKNKWSILLDPTFQHYNADMGSAAVNYKSIEIPLGLRHYFFLNETTKLFLNAFLVWDIPFDSEVSSTGLYFYTVPTLTIAFGGGLSSGKFSVEFRNHSTRHATAPVDTYYNKFSFIMGYRLFQKVGRSFN